MLRHDLEQEVTTAVELAFNASTQVGVFAGGWTAVQPTWAAVIEALDLWLVMSELLAVAIVCVTFSLTRVFMRCTQSGYDAVVTLCQARGISFAEVATVVTVLGGFIIFDFFVTLAEDDLLEAVSYAFALIIGLALGLLILAVDVQYYYTISAVSGGAATLRVIYTDVINNGLCVLRVFFC